MCHICFHKAVKKISCGIFGKKRKKAIPLFQTNYFPNPLLELSKFQFLDKKQPKEERVLVTWLTSPGCSYHCKYTG